MGLAERALNQQTNKIARFDKDASRYHAGVYARKRADLVVQLDNALGPLFFGQLKNLHAAALSKS